MIIQTTKQMRPRETLDHYPTPIALCHAALNLVPGRYTHILDAGCGDGVWTAAALSHFGDAATYYGIDIELRPHRDDTYFDYFDHEDFLTWQPAQRFDLIIGNPPYRHAESFVRKALGLLEPGGWLVFLLRLAFLEGRARGDGLWRDCPPRHVAVCSRRPSFTGNGKTDATAYAVFVWQQGWEGTTTLGWLKGEGGL